MPTLVREFDKRAPAVPPEDILVGEGESAVIAAAKNGDARAFEVLVKRHERRMFFVALRITRNKEDAEDVVQQSFQKTFVHLNSFLGRSSFSTWLTRVATNEAIMLLRNRGSRAVLVDDMDQTEDVAALLEVPDLSPDPETNYSRLEWGRILSSAVNELPRRTRRAIQLRELDERSTEETARIMGVTVGAVKARVFQGRRKLRERLKHHVGSVWRFGRDTSRAISNARRISQSQVTRDACG
jgi:RNA polymerase sigma-70 factor (ECF subfamily)